MEPLTGISSVVSIVNGTRTTAESAVTLGAKAIRRVRLDAIDDPKWLSLGLGDSAPRLSAETVADVDEFLRTERVAPVLGFVALTKLAPEGKNRTEILDTLKIAFSNEIQRWNVNHPSRKLPTISLWGKINSIYDGSLPLPGSIEELRDSIDEFTEFVNTPLNYGFSAAGGEELEEPDNTDNEDSDNREGPKDTLPPTQHSYLRRLRTLAQDISRLVDAATNAARLAEVAHGADYDALISHMELEKQIKFSQLYVSRDFARVGTGELIQSEHFLDSPNPFRIVLRGAPGAGKSTFVSQLVQALADPERRRRPKPTAVVRCREYSQNSWQDSLPSYITKRMNTLYSTKISESECDDLFLTGQLVLVVDGLDEIASISQRSEMVQRIQALVVQYPSTSVLVTTREVGYEQAPVNHHLFQHLRLREFSADQFSLYCSNWFGLVGRPELVDSFIHESAALEDLRKNPLLLSLLCNLYRGNGYIPNNRRELYSECANMLFHRWDAHRQIRQSEVMPRFGNKLMAEIARVFYSRPESGGRLEERVIQRAISRYMVNALAFMHEEAEPAARDFLSFCAGRAWFLRLAGSNPYEERLFEFTHRTFYEFFTAESLAARPDPPESTESREACIAGLVMNSYGRDRSSLLPELLVQAYEARNEFGASTVFTELCQLGAFNHLLLRLLDGTTLTPDALETGFTLITARWSSRESDMKQSELMALLGINPIARRYFVRYYMQQQNTEPWQIRLCDSWSIMILTGRSLPALQPWLDPFKQLIGIITNGNNETHSSALTNLLIAMEGAPKSLDHPWKYLAFQAHKGGTPGVVWWAISTIFQNEDRPLVLTTALREAAESVHTQLMNRGWIPHYVISALIPYVEALPISRQRWQNTNNSGGTLKLLSDILAFIVIAVDTSNYQENSIDKVLALLPSDWAALRRWYGRENLSEHDESVIRGFREQIPALESWYFGRKSLVR